MSGVIVGIFRRLLGRLFPQKRSAAQKKGIEGERRVAGILDRMGFEYIDDVYLFADGSATQIDHVAKVGNVILVIETKNYSGKIYAREKALNWQCYVGGKKYDFFNPIKQNAKHIKAVRQVVGSTIDVRGMVVFVGDARFASKVPEGVVVLAALRRELGLVFQNSGSRPSADHWASFLRFVGNSDRREAVRAHTEVIAKRSGSMRVGEKAVGRQEPSFTEEW